MNTEVILKRELYGGYISQKSKSGFFSQTDLFKIGNRYRTKNNLPIANHTDYYLLKGSKEFIKELEEKFGKVKISARGRGEHTWIHPLLFIDIALWLNPKLKIEAYSWLYDNLLKYRNDSGDSYKRMCGALYVRANKTDFVKNISKLADLIKKECGLLDSEDWNNCDEWKLKLRDLMHDRIYILAEALNNNKEAIRLGIESAKKDYKENNKKDISCF